MEGFAHGWSSEGGPLLFDVLLVNTRSVSVSLLPAAIGSSVAPCRIAGAYLDSALTPGSIREISERYIDRRTVIGFER